MSRAAGLTRSLDEAGIYSARFVSYLAGAGRIYQVILPKQCAAAAGVVLSCDRQGVFVGEWLFPGATALLLAAVALVTGLAVRDRRARLALVIGAVALVLSFGPAFTPYRWLYGVFPLMGAIRGASRFGQIVLASTAILAGFGLAILQRRLKSQAGMIVGLVCVLAVHVEAWRAPFLYYEYGGIPPVYDALEKAEPGSVLVWMPFYSSAQFNLNAPFMLVSTRSWHRMLNGYSGFKPPSLYRHAEALAAFPDAGSIRYLQQLGVTHVLVNGRAMRPPRLEALDEFPELKLWVTDGNLRIYLLAKS